jgi:hypothetical protein
MTHRMHRTGELSWRITSLHDSDRARQQQLTERAGASGATGMAPRAPATTGMWDTGRFRHKQAAREARVVEDDDYWKVVMDIRKKKHSENLAATNHRWDTRIQVRKTPSWLRSWADCSNL